MITPFVPYFIGGVAGIINTVNKNKKKPLSSQCVS
jgi:hypothetical protein